MVDRRSSQLLVAGSWHGKAGHGRPAPSSYLPLTTAARSAASGVVEELAVGGGWLKRGSGGEAGLLLVLVDHRQ